MKFTFVVLALCAGAAMAAITAPANDAKYVTFDSVAEELDFVKPSAFCFRFSAKGSNDAHILLSPKANVERIDNAYEVVLGGWGNTKSVIRVGTQGQVVDTFPLNPNIQGNVMSASEARRFWISLVDGELSVGRGPVCYSDVIMTATFRIGTPTKYNDVAHIAVGAWDTPVVFSDLSVVDAESDWMQFNVPGNGRLYTVFNCPNQITLNTEAFELVFKARGDAATIGFLDGMRSTSEHAIEVVIDAHNSTTTEIWKGTRASGKAKLIANFPYDRKKFPNGHISLTEYRPFWIHKYGSAVSMGTGEKVGQNAIAYGVLPNIGFDTAVVGWTAKDYPTSYIMRRSANVTMLSEEEEDANLADYFDAITEAHMETEMIKGGSGFHSKLYEEWQHDHGELNLNSEDEAAWTKLQYKLAALGNPTAIAILEGIYPKPTPPKETAAQWEVNNY